MADRPLDRRDFFRASFRELFRAAADTADALRGRRRARPVRRLRPPGALPEGAFLSACTRCDDCVQACPAQCITHVPGGHADEGTPVIVPATRACVLCTDLACTHVCEPGALRPLARPEAVQIGLAWVDPAACVAFAGETCTVCRDACPVEPCAIEIDGGRPRVRADLCTGCGLCEERCPTRPRSVEILLRSREAGFAPWPPEGEAGAAGGARPAPAG